MIFSLKWLTDYPSSKFFSGMLGQKGFCFHHFVVRDKVSKLQPGSPVKRKCMNCLNKHLHCLLYQIKLSKHYTIPVFIHTRTSRSWSGKHLSPNRQGGGDWLIWSSGFYRYKVKPSNSPAMCFLLSSTLSSRKASFRTWPFSRGPIIRHWTFSDKALQIEVYWFLTVLTQAVHSLIIFLFLTGLKRGKFKILEKYSPSHRNPMKAHFP